MQSVAAVWRESGLQEEIRISRILPGPDQTIPESPDSDQDVRLRVVYAVQNAGGIDLEVDLGDGVPVKNSLMGLQARGHRVSCLSLNGRSVLDIPDVSTPSAARRIRVGLSGAKPFLWVESAIRRVQKGLRLPYFAFFDSFRFYEACLRVLPGADLCHEHHGLFGVGTALACYRLGIPYVLTFSADQLLEKELKGVPLRGIHRLVAVWETKLSLTLADRVICVSNATRRNLVSRWGLRSAKIEVLPNGVDLKLFGAHADPGSVRQEWGLDGGPIVTFVGGFQIWHGIEFLVECFRRVVEAVPNAKLLLVGDGPTRPAVERAISNLGLESSVQVTGLVPQQKVPAILAASDVAVLPYPQLPQEMWFSPLKLYEYMAAGKAIVATRSGQIEEVLRDQENGILIEPGDVVAFAEAITSLCNDPARASKLGASASRQARQSHSWEHYVERVETIYRRTLKEGSN